MLVINKKTKNTVFDILLLVSCLLFSLYGAAKGANSYGLPAIAIVSAMLLVSSPERCFLILIAMIPYGECWKIGGTSVRGLMCVIPLISMFRYGKLYRNKVPALIAGMLLTIIECVNDLRLNDIFSVFNTVAPIIYFCFFVSLAHDTEKWDITRMGYVFVLSTLIVELTILQVGGGFSSYHNDIAYYRFGQESSKTYLPGAMEIPVFTCISIFFLISVLLCKKNLKITQKISNIALIVLNLVFGIMTVSRVFVIGIVAILLITVLWLFKNNKIKQIRNMVILLFAVGAVLSFFFSDLVSLLIDKLFARLVGGSFSSGSDGRTYIWLGCIDYLLSHPVALLFGNGIVGYTIVGQQEGYVFSAQAHNFFLDIWMGVGLIGMICLFIMMFFLFKRQKRQQTKSLLSWGVIVILVMMFLVSGTLNYIRNYIYILLAIIIHNNFREQIEKG